MTMRPVSLWALCAALAVASPTTPSPSNTAQMNVGVTPSGPTEVHANFSSTTAAETAVTPTGISKQEAVSTDSPGGETATSPAGAGGSSWTPPVSQIATTASETHASPSSTIRDSLTRAQDQQLSSTSGGTTSPSAFPSASSPQHTSTSGVQLTSVVSFNVSSGSNVTVFTQSPSSPTVSVGVTTPVEDSTSTVTQTSTGTESQTHSISPTNTSISSTEVFTSAETLTSSASSSTSSVGIIIIPDSKVVPDPPATSTPKSTSTSQQVSQGPAITEVPRCSTRSVVKNCLIVIASLAAIATIFIICTIALCTKLSVKKYDVRRMQQGTEMMCISNLLRERNHSYRRQRNPITNGVLVFPGGDSDEDGDDNHTLSSFLPEGDHYV